MPLVVRGGLLRDAATKKNDERILLQIMDEDCVAIPTVARSNKSGGRMLPI